jgi:hypothetical protein
MLSVWEEPVLHSLANLDGFFVLFREDQKRFNCKISRSLSVQAMERNREQKYVTTVIMRLGLLEH